MELQKNELLKLEEKLTAIPPEKWKLSDNGGYEFVINKLHIRISKNFDGNNRFNYYMRINNYYVFGCDDLAKILYNSIEKYKNELSEERENIIKEKIIKFLQEQ